MLLSASVCRCVFLVCDSFRRTGTDGDGRLVCRLGPVLCPSSMEDLRKLRREAGSGSRFWSGCVWRIRGSVVAVGVHQVGLPAAIDNYDQTTSLISTNRSPCFSNSRAPARVFKKIVFK